jgi:hypothetical protein
MYCFPRLKRIFYFVFSLFIVSYLSCGIFPSNSDKKAIDYVGGWRLYKSCHVQLTHINNSIAFDTTVGHVGFINKGDSLASQIGFESLIITPTRVFSSMFLEDAVCSCLVFPSYVIENDTLFPGKWISNKVFEKDSFTVVYKQADTLVRKFLMTYGTNLLGFSLYFFVKENSINANNFCPESSYIMPACMDYGCDSSIPLVLAYFDKTPQDIEDAGVFVYSVCLKINDRIVIPDSNNNGFRSTFLIDQNNILIPRDVPVLPSQNGCRPVLIQFTLNRGLWMYSDSTHELGAINKIEVISAVAGNYRVAILTGEQNIVSINNNPANNLSMKDKIIWERQTIAESPKALTITRDSMNSLAILSWRDANFQYFNNYNADTINYVWFSK